MKYLHFFPNEKFTKPYIDFVNNNFDKTDHLFLVMGSTELVENSFIGYTNVIHLKKNIAGFAGLISYLYQAKKILLHSLLKNKLIYLLSLQPWLLKKCNWIIWGGDLYRYKSRQKNLKSNIQELFKKHVIKHMGTLITQIEGDYELAQKWYNAKGSYFYSFMYPSNLYKDFKISNYQRDKSAISIQVGNSADPSNNHLEIIHSLERYSDKSIEIICPLSYGDKEYTMKVIEEGTKIFGDKFIPIVDFLPFNDYLNLLAKIDIAIFNHDRQQGMGNIVTLLGLGKKVYIRKNTTPMAFFSKLSIEIHDSSDKRNFNSLFHNANTINYNNIAIIKNVFSERELIKQQTTLFNE